jgi:hypothetical protein
MKEFVLNSLQPFRHLSNVLVYNQGIGDIISGILLTHKKYFSEYDKISSKFWKGSSRATAKCIYDFLKSNTHYVVEPDNKQTLRSPSAILYMGSDKKTGLDCKSYSLFIGGVLDSLKRAGYPIDWTYRFASYKAYDKLPHHVFVVLNPGTANEIFVDPVLPSFNFKKQYFHYLDKKPMALIAMAGIGRTKRTKEQKQSRKNKIKAAIKKTGRIMLKFAPATVASRNAFLLLVKINAFNLGRRLYKLISAGHSQKLKSFWEKVGGNYKSLVKNIAEGAKQKAPVDSVAGIGVVPAIAAAIAAATPIVLKITQLLKSAGIDVKDLEKKGAQIVKGLIDKKVNEAADSDEPLQNEGSEVVESTPLNDQGGGDQEAQSESDQEGGEVSGIPSWIEKSTGFNKAYWGPPERIKKPRMKTGNNKPQIGNFA